LNLKGAQTRAPCHHQWNKSAASFSHPPTHPPLTMKGRGGLKRLVPGSQRRRRLQEGTEDSVERTGYAGPSTFPATGTPPRKGRPFLSPICEYRILASTKEEAIFFFFFLIVICGVAWLLGCVLCLCVWHS